MWLGVSEEEQINGNDFTVNISFEADTQTPGMSDNIEDAIDYSIVYELIKQEMNISAKLIENVAYRIMKRLKVEIPQIKQFFEQSKFYLLFWNIGNRELANKVKSMKEI